MSNYIHYFSNILSQFLAVWKGILDEFLHQPIKSPCKLNRFSYKKSKPAGYYFLEEHFKWLQTWLGKHWAAP